MLIVIPFLFVLILGLIDIGLMFRTRIIVESMARDAARNAAADGGNFNPRTNTDIPWDQWARERLVENGSCTQSRCEEGELPTVDCTRVTDTAGNVTTRNTARFAGDLITCTIDYPYKAVNKGLLDSAFGLGLGSMINPFTISVSARAETGTDG